MVHGKVGKKGNGLNRFAQTHLVCQDTIDVVVVETRKPIQSVVLIFA
jgi:hypothetical protein